LQQVNVGAMLKPGVYLLHFHDKVVYVGRSAHCMLSAIDQHRRHVGKRVPEWYPLKGVRFDDVTVIPCAHDRQPELLEALNAYYLPHKLESKVA
jgi:hypothetical protein